MTGNKPYDFEHEVTVALMLYDTLSCFLLLNGRYCSDDYKTYALFSNLHSILAVTFVRYTTLASIVCKQIFFAQKMLTVI